MVLATPALLRSEGPFVQVASAARLRPYRKPLPIPRVLTGSNLTLPMRQAEVQVLPGKKTKMWTYGGDFPGPTIRRPTGVTTRVDLPAPAADERRRADRASARRP